MEPDVDVRVFDIEFGANAAELVAINAWAQRQHMPRATACRLAVMRAVQRDMVAADGSAKEPAPPVRLPIAGEAR